MSDLLSPTPNASPATVDHQNSNAKKSSSRRSTRPTPTVSAVPPQSPLSDYNISTRYDHIAPYDPTGHYTSAYSRVATGGQAQLASQKYGDFSERGAKSRGRSPNRNRPLNKPTSPDNGGSELDDSIPAPVDVAMRDRFVRGSPPGYGDMAYNHPSSIPPNLVSYGGNSRSAVLGGVDKLNIIPGRNFSFSDADYDDDDYAYGSDSDHGLFVDGTPIRYSKHGSRLEKKVVGGLRGDRPRKFSHDDYSRQPASRHPAQPPENVEKDHYFNNFGRNLGPSRYSGVPMPWGVHQDPKMQMHEEVSDAALLKRNIKRGRGEKVCKRGYGANDPENIAIVNMKEVEGLTFQEIAEQLNNKRVIAGKNPTLSICGVNARYNRTAPLLFAAHGKEFVPLSQRRSKEKDKVEKPAGPPGGEKPVWNEELDLELVKCVKEVEGQKWLTVAEMFEEKTGKPMNAKAAALRHSML